MNDNDLFIQDETFYYAVAGQTLQGFRAIFNFYDSEGDPLLITENSGGTNSTSRGTFLVDGKPIDDGTTGIRNRYIFENKRVYSVTGRYIGENVNMKSLPKGVYIVDGVKIVND